MIKSVLNQTTSERTLDRLSATRDGLRRSERGVGWRLASGVQSSYLWMPKVIHSDRPSIGLIAEKTAAIGDAAMMRRKCLVRADWGMDAYGYAVGTTDTDSSLLVSS